MFRFSVALILIFLGSVLCASADECPKTDTYSAQPMPSLLDSIGRVLSLSGSVSDPIYVGPIQSSKPKSQINFKGAIALFDFDESGDACGSSSLKYSRQYGADASGQIRDGLKDLLNSENIVSVSEQGAYSFTARKSANGPLLTTSFGLNYLHGPCCGITNPDIKPASFYHSTFMQIDVFAGRPNAGIRHGPFDLTVEYDNGSLSKAPSTPVANPGSTVYLSFQPQLSFSIFGDSSGNIGSVTYTHNQSQYANANSNYYGNDYGLNFSHDIIIHGKIPGADETVGTIGLSASKFTKADPSAAFAPPFSFKSTTVSLSVSSSVLPWHFAFPAPSYSYDYDGAYSDMLPSNSGTRIPITFYHDDKTERITPLVSVRIGSKILHLVFDTGSSGIRIFQSSSDENQKSIEYYSSFGIGNGRRGYFEHYYTNDVTLVDDSAKRHGNPQTILDLGSQQMTLVSEVCTLMGDSEPNLRKADRKSACQPTFLKNEKYNQHADGIFGVRASSPPINEPSSLSGNHGNPENSDDAYVPLSQLLPALGDMPFIVSFRDGGPDASVIIPGAGFTDSEFKPVALGDIGYQADASRLAWCYSSDISGGSSRSCSDNTVTQVLMDTGGGFATLVMPSTQTVFAGVPQERLTKLGNGLTITAYLMNTETNKPTSLSWRFTPGNCLFNSVRVWVGAPPKHLPSTDGINPFFGNDIFFNYKKNLLGIRPLRLDRLPYC